MLITSSGAQGKCPVCGAANCTCGGPSNVTAVDERVSRAMTKGKLVRINVGRGAGIQMYEEEARKQGLLPPLVEEKKREPAQNKMRRPGRNKGS